MRKLCIALAVAVLLSACGPPPPLSDEMVADEPEPLNSSVSAVFLVDTSLDDAFLAGAEHFAETVSALTDGRFHIEIRQSSGAAVHFAAGRGEFAFLDGVRGSRYCDSFSALSKPFLYRDYDVFTMAVNSERLLSLVEDTMVDSHDSLPLGAFYQPSYHLITNWQPADYLQFTRASIAVDPESRSREGFSLLGASVNDVADPQERLELLRQGWLDGAEFLLSELESTDWRDREADVDYYLTMTYHTATPVWLMTEAEFYHGLPGEYKAALLEATAVLYGDLDNTYVRQERELRNQLLRRGILDGRDISGAREEIYSLGLESADPEEEPDLWEEYVRRFVSGLE